MMAANNVLATAPERVEKTRETPRGSLLRYGVLTGRREACGCFVAEECRECEGRGVVLIWTGISPEWAVRI